MENVTLKLNFALSLVPCDYSMLITLYKIGGVHFRLLGTNGFHVKAKNERFPAASTGSPDVLLVKSWPLGSCYLRIILRV